MGKSLRGSRYSSRCVERAYYNVQSARLVLGFHGSSGLLLNGLEERLAEVAGVFRGDLPADTGRVRQGGGVPGWDALPRLWLASGAARSVLRILSTSSELATFRWCL